MTISHNGAICTSGDTAGDFTTLNSGANISTDDNNVEGTGAIGDKMSGTNELLVSDTLSGGASGVYDFSVAGADEGKHILGWSNSKTPLVATGGLQIYVGNASAHNGQYYVDPVNYTGGFILKCIDPARDMDTAATWTTTGNPAQLDDVSAIGFEFDVSGTIMGNFNTNQIDQMVVGFGIRVASNRLTFGTTSGVTSGTDVITVTTHGWAHGTPVFYDKEGGSVDIGLTDLTIYYLNASSTTDVSIHATRADALADTSPIDLTATGGETHSITPAYAMEDIRVFDQDTNFFGWWSSANGAHIGRGKVNIGPASGNAESRFSDSAFTVVFADELVAVGHYAFDMIGTDTLVDWNLAFISSANTADDNNRWDIAISATFGDTAGFGFNDTSGVWVNGGTLTLNSSCTLTGTALVNCSLLDLGDGATMDGCTVLESNVASDVSFVRTSDLADISDCTFTGASGNLGHAIRIDTIGTYAFQGNTFDGTWGADDSTTAMIENSSAGLVTINVSDGTAVTVKNTGGGSYVVNANVAVTLTGLVNPTEIRVYTTATTTELAGQEDVTSGSFVISLAAATAIDIRVYSVSYDPITFINFIMPASAASIPITQIFDRNYRNP